MLNDNYDIWFSGKHDSISNTSTVRKQNQNSKYKYNVISNIPQDILLR
jgi:hypothetical protein